LKILCGRLAKILAEPFLLDARLGPGLEKARAFFSACPGRTKRAGLLATGQTKKARAHEPLNSGFT